MPDDPVERIGGRGTTAEGPTSVVPRRMDRPVPRRERLLRVCSIALLGVIVGCAALGLLGARTGVAVAISNGFRLEATYARISRPGLAQQLSILVTSEDGSPLPAEVELRLDAAYLALLDDNGIEPAPVRSFNTDRWTSWTFAVPTGESRLRVDLDSRLEPGAQWGADGSASVVFGGSEVVNVRFTTWVLP